MTLLIIYCGLALVAGYTLARLGINNKQIAKLKDELIDKMKEGLEAADVKLTMAMKLMDLKDKRLELEKARHKNCHSGFQIVLDKRANIIKEQDEKLTQFRLLTIEQSCLISKKEVEIKELEHKLLAKENKKECKCSKKKVKTKRRHTDAYND